MDIDMEFGQYKCAFVFIGKGLIKTSLPLNISHLTIPVADGVKEEA